jgi:ribosomal protein S18 acetylase RimI-like enzyme
VRARVTTSPPALRPATRADAPALAALHASRISEGFLSELGVPFLTRLYRRVAVSPVGVALVAVDPDAATAGTIVGFAAGATDLGRLYRTFVVRDGVSAGLVAAPRLARSWRRVLETLRYPAAAEDLPDAEILAVAVDDAVAGRGIGRRLVTATTEELAARGVRAMKVVAGADNAPALALYRACGFTPRARIAVHAGTASEVLVWSSS